MKNEMNSFLMMPMGFYYIGVVLRNYVHENVSFCIMGGTEAWKMGILSIFAEIDAFWRL